MRPSAVLLCLILLAWTVPARAQSEIHRCIGANGSAVFTDQPCAALQATPANRPRAPSGNDLPPAGPPPIMCAASLGALRQSVIDAFASRDANRMAGLMLWDGYGRNTVIANIRSLAELMKQPLLGLDAPNDPASAASNPSAPAMAVSSADPFAALEAPPNPAPTNDQLVLHTGGDDGSGSPHELRFSVVSRAGCLWLRRAD